MVSITWSECARAAHDCGGGCDAICKVVGWNKLHERVYDT